MVTLIGGSTNVKPNVCGIISRQSEYSCQYVKLGLQSRWLVFM